ncbi:MAG: hypothetical protein J6B68_09980 [Lachnospiraceae bacterium]|nr:hypothetical protein [Lachnospiraceae bacterium]
MKKKDLSSTFQDNMSLPIHRWYRYTAGFSAEWVEQVVNEYSKKNENKNIVVLDPFAGSGTTLLACDKIGVTSYGYESHPLVNRIASAKLMWDVSVDSVSDLAKEVIIYAKENETTADTFPEIVTKCYDESNLLQITSLKKALKHYENNSKEYSIVWVGFVSMLRAASHAGTATWQYVLPNKTKAKVSGAYEAFEKQIDIMVDDINQFQSYNVQKRSTLLMQDAREKSTLEDNSIDLVVTSPPYANNYDYADATRLELSVLGEIRSWGDLQKVIRPGLVRSCSQMVSKEKPKTYEFLKDPLLTPIYDEIYEVCKSLEAEKENHGGKKNYYTMIALYFLDLAKIWQDLRRVCKEDSLVCFVIGDSAPYGVYVPVDEWLGKLAVNAGFKEYWFEKTRDRNVKWKNRKHTVPLKEGRLWVRG